MTIEGSAVASGGMGVNAAPAPCAHSDPDVLDVNSHKPSADGAATPESESEDR